MHSTDRPWTVDSIAHALPHSELRATFMREVSFTDVRELPVILDRWVSFIEDFEASRDRVEQLRSLLHNNGHLPPNYTASLVQVDPAELRAAVDASARQQGAA
ncbi:hypothetical protein [Streptomyces lydicus]|uniref:hypothetical protein n=1 Tax=Streptomyces lydicus TaxID=47763 RepID=UPI0036E69714